MSLVDLDLPAPTPGLRDLLVRVQAVSVNPVDAKVRARVTPAEGQPHILGYDAVGIVEAVGEEARLFEPGIPCSTPERWGGRDECRAPLRR